MCALQLQSLALSKSYNITIIKQKITSTTSTNQLPLHAII